MVTYVNDLRLSELATGEGSGTWGTTTNTNLELIGESLGYGTEQSFSSDADATTTIGDGVSDPARAMYFKITSAGSLTATRTLTIAPNTVSRVMFIENATTGSQSIAISQGSGANVTIAAGKTAVVYLDGAGSGAAVVDAMAGVDPGVTDTLAEVLAAGNTTTTDQKIQFRDTGIYINSSADGQLDIVADTEIQIAATTIDINGAINASGEIIAASLDISGDIDVDGTTNLDAVDIDGAVDMASTLAVGGVVTANAGVVVDTMTIDGNAIASTGSLGLDIGGNLTIDVDGTTITLADGGANWGQMFNSAQNFFFKNPTSDKDILFQGIDGGSTITALTLDMSNAGAATFNGNLTVNGADVTVIANINHAGDSDTYYGFHGNDLWRVVTGGVERFEVSNSGIIINDSGAAADFRVESDTNANMLFVDASTNRVGVGTSGPLEILHGHNGSGDDGTYLRLSGGGSLNESYGGWMRGYGVSGNGGFLELGVVDAGTKKTAMQVTAQGNNLKFYTAAVERLQFDYLGNTVFNESGVNSDFRVESSGNANMLFVDGGANKVGIGVVPVEGSLTIKSSGNTYATSALVLEDTDSTTRSYITHVNGDLAISNNGSTDQLVINAAGAATFSSTVTANSFLQTNSADYQHKFFLANGTTGVGYIYSTGSTFQMDTQASQPMELLVNGAARLTLGTGGSATFNPAAGGHAVFNEGGIDADFRVESDSNANMLFVDASANKVGIGTNSLGRVFNVYDAATDGAIKLETGGNTSSIWSGIEFKTPNSTGFIYVPSDNSAGLMKFLPASAEVLALSNSAVVVNETGSNVDFRVESDTDANALVVDGGTGTTTVKQLALGVGGGLNGLGPISISTTATAITGVNDYGSLVIVAGNSAGAIFSDLVFYATTIGATVITGGSVSGGPAARTYSVVGSILKLAMASGTYSVSATTLQGTL